jgi:hypothetical protein
VDAPLGEAEPARIAELRFSGVAINNHHIEIASLAWQAYRAATPKAWFNLLSRDLSILPQLRRCVVEMLEELPGRTTGLGASELRILELISAGYVHPFHVFPHYRQRFQRRVFGYWEAGLLLEGLALAPAPAVSGLAEWPFTLEMHNASDRLERYKKSRLSLTPLGKAILAQAEDSAATIRSIAGGAAPGSPTIACGVGARFWSRHSGATARWIERSETHHRAPPAVTTAMGFAFALPILRQPHSAACA